jgi:NADH:ubiquinone oxidoreductase subunit C
MNLNKNQINYKLLDFITYLIQIVPHYLKKVTVRKDELILYTSKENLVSLIIFLKKHNRTKLTQLVDICGVDYLDRTERFEVIYNFLSLQHNYRLRVVVQTDEFTPLPSITSLFSSAFWLEREV